MKISKILLESDDPFDFDLDGNITPEEVIRAYKDGVRRTPHDHWLDLSSMKLKKIPVPCPDTIRKGFDASNNFLTNFEHMPHHVYGPYGVRLHNNRLTSLKGIDHYLKSITGEHGLDLSMNPLRSHFLSLLRINGLQKVILADASGSKKLHEAQRIINSHLPSNGGSRDIIKCQSDLLDAGLDQYAEL